MTLHSTLKILHSSVEDQYYQVYVHHFAEAGICVAEAVHFDDSGVYHSGVAARGVGVAIVNTQPDEKGKRDRYMRRDGAILATTRAMNALSSFDEQNALSFTTLNRLDFCEPRRLTRNLRRDIETKFGSNASTIDFSLIIQRQARAIRREILALLRRAACPSLITDVI